MHVIWKYDPYGRFSGQYGKETDLRNGYQHSRVGGRQACTILPFAYARKCRCQQKHGHHGVNRYAPVCAAKQPIPNPITDTDKLGMDPWMMIAGGELPDNLLYLGYGIAAEDSRIKPKKIRQPCCQHEYHKKGKPLPALFFFFL